MKNWQRDTWYCSLPKREKTNGWYEKPKKMSPDESQKDIYHVVRSEHRFASGGRPCLGMGLARGVVRKEAELGRKMFFWNLANSILCLWRSEPGKEGVVGNTGKRVDLNWGETQSNWKWDGRRLLKEHQVGGVQERWMGNENLLNFTYDSVGPW